MSIEYNPTYQSVEIYNVDDSNVKDLFTQIIEKYPQIQILNCSCNELTSLPESIGQLSSLKELYCSFNKLTSLPESIGELSSLQILYCWNNQLTILPESIGQLSSLKELYCSSNRLTELPESIGQLSSLQRLRCSYNQLSSLPDSIGMEWPFWQVDGRYPPLERAMVRQHFRGIGSFGCRFPGSLDQE